MPGKTIFKVLLNPILTKIEVSIFDLVHMIGAHQHTDLTRDCDTDKEIPTEDGKFVYIFLLFLYFVNNLNIFTYKSLILFRW